MARPLRLEVPGAIYHVTSHADGDEMLFRGDDERRRFLIRYGEAIRRHGWFSLAYCLMGTHYHLLIETPRTTLAAGMRDLNGNYAQDCHARRETNGHVFGGRYFSRLVQRDAHLLAAARYIARNPLEAGLCRAALDWRWSSHRDLCHGRSTATLHADRLLRYFCEESLVDGAARYRRFVDDEDRPDSVPAEDVGVSADWEYARVHLPPELPSVQIPRRYLEPTRRPLDEILRSAHRDEAARAARAAGYTLREIGDGLGVHLSTVSRWISGRARPR